MNNPTPSNSVVTEALVDRIVQYAREHEAAVRFNGPFVGNMEARLNDAVAHVKALLTNPPKHRFWAAGEPDCPREIKASNGELHTLRCKLCVYQNQSGEWEWMIC